MPRPHSRRRHNVGAGVALAVLALVAGFGFAGTGREEAPPSEARDQALRAAAVRIVLEGDELEVPREAPSARTETYPLLPDADQISTSTVATRIRIESVGIDAEVRSVGLTLRNGQIAYDTPRVAAGQYAGSAAPGEVGNTVIAGHVARRSGAAVFEELPGVSVGDVIEVFRGDEVFRYRITELRRVAPDATEVMAATSDTRVTLITCLPENNFSDRLVVVGQLI